MTSHTITYTSGVSVQMAKKHALPVLSWILRLIGLCHSNSCGDPFRKIFSCSNNSWGYCQKNWGEGVWPASQNPYPFYE